MGALVWAYLPNYICAALAVVPSHVLRRMSRQISRAREMGSYHLGDLIGRGGMGEVWHAHHRLLARPAAIKLIRAESTLYDTTGTSRLALQRFRREAEAAASLRSPHTIQLYDFGMTADGRFYLVMELLDGIDLESLVRRFGPQPPQRVIHLLRQACHSLAEAHAAGLVHRDIKPANLHLCRLGLEYDFVKVLDFGLVKHETGSASEQTLLSGAGHDHRHAGLHGARAGHRRADRRPARSLLARLRGLLPADGRAGVRGGQRPAYDRAASPDGARSRPRSAPDEPVPAALEHAILACLAKEPAGRPASAIELSGRLAAVDVSPWSPEDAEAWWEAHLGGVGAAPRRSCSPRRGPPRRSRWSSAGDPIAPGAVPDLAFRRAARPAPARQPTPAPRPAPRPTACPGTRCSRRWARTAPTA